MAETKRSQTRATAGTCECLGLGQTLVDLKKKLDACLKTVQSQNAKIDELSNTVKELTRKLEEEKCTAFVGSQSVVSASSYSDIVKQGVAREHVLVVKPSTKVTDKSLKNQLMSSIKPESLQIGVQINKTTSKGNIVLKCDSQESLEKVKTTIETQLRDSCSVTLPKKLNPRLRIVGIHEDNSAETDVLRAKILKQNTILSQSNHKTVFNVLYKYQIKNGKFDIIAEVDPISFNGIIREGKLNIGWSRCNVYEHLSVVRCFKCCEYGHIAVNCNNDIVCPVCAGNHERRSCDLGNSPKCINCVTANRRYKSEFDVKHRVWDRSCPCLKKAESVQRGKTDYTL